jgi:myo-inositol-1(or 4)-monophosphatase
MSDTPDLQEIHDFLIDIAAEAGKLITSSLPRIDSTGSKKNSTSQFHSMVNSKTRK